MNNVILGLSQPKINVELVNIPRRQPSSPITVWFIAVDSALVRLAAGESLEIFSDLFLPVQTKIAETSIATRVWVLVPIGNEFRFIFGTSNVIRVVVFVGPDHKWVFRNGALRSSIDPFHLNWWVKSSQYKESMALGIAPEERFTPGAEWAGEILQVESTGTWSLYPYILRLLPVHANVVWVHSEQLVQALPFDLRTF